MCGIAGSIGVSGDGTLKTMLDTLQHRGPDDRGEYYDHDHGVALGHQRLSILDLSSAGHQPMSDKSGSIWVTFNGEIYNYQLLITDLKRQGYEFRSHSDTEVLIHGYAAYGEEIFKKIDGMWAIALYDKDKQLLFLSRDPAGIKPLYVYRSNEMLLFASEIGALSRALPAHALSTNELSAHRFLAHGYVYGAQTIYNEIVRLQPGVTVAYHPATVAYEEHGGRMPQNHVEVADAQDALSTFNELLSSAVLSTLQSDVPVGLFLSGGIDSSLVGYHIKKAGAMLQAFTIGFPEHSFDESPVAAQISKHLGFPHTTYMLEGKEVAADAVHILDSFGEPFADTSALPMYYVSKRARESGIKVALGGDGADELFGGYPTHYLPRIAELYRVTPMSTDTLLRECAELLPSRFSKLGNKEKLLRFVHAVRDPYRRAHSKWKRVFNDEEMHALLSPYAETSWSGHDLTFDAAFPISQSDTADIPNELMRVDFVTFLQGSCLVKSDIASMQHGLEVRVPFLTRDMIDFAWHLPGKYKVGSFATKKILRAALAQQLPADIARMKKQGFVPPLAWWLTRELRPLMTDILSENNVAKTKFLRYNYVSSLIAEHLEARADNSKKIWTLMSFVRFVTR